MADIVKISSYGRLVASSLVISFFGGFYQLMANVLPNMDFTKCFDLSLSDLSFTVKYELDTRNFFDHAEIHFVDYDWPMPKTELHSECIKEVTQPFATALTIGAAAGVFLSVILFLVNSLPKNKKIEPVLATTNRVNPLNADETDFKEEEDEDLSRIAFSV